MTDALDIEDEIIAVCLTQRVATREIADLLNNHNFFTLVDRQRIYQVILDLHQQAYNTDLLTVSAELTRRWGNDRSGQKSWLILLTQITPLAQRHQGNLVRKAQLVIENYLRRRLVSLSNDAVINLQDPTIDPLKQIDELTNELTRLRNGMSSMSDQPFSKALNEAVKLAEEAGKSGSPITGIPTGLTELDRYLKGLNGGTLTVMAARPGTGKTAEACQIAFNVAFGQDRPVAFFSLEMNRLQIARRMLAIGSGFKNTEITSGMDSYGTLVDVDKLFSAAGQLSEAPLFVYDQVHTLPHFKAKVNQLVSKHPGILIIVDYLQLMLAGDESDHSEYARICTVSRELKKTTINYNVPILALAQLKREAEGKEDRPRLTHLKGSGSIEQDADNVVFLYSPSAYNTVDSAGRTIDKRLLVNIIAKNRNGSTHNEDEGIQLDYEKPTNRVKDYVEPF